MGGRAATGKSAVACNQLVQRGFGPALLTFIEVNDGLGVPRIYLCLGS